LLFKILSPLDEEELKQMFQNKFRPRTNGQLRKAITMTEVAGKIIDLLSRETICGKEALDALALASLIIETNKPVTKQPYRYGKGVGLCGPDSRSG